MNIIGAFYPNKVIVSGEGLKGGLLGRDLDIRIDTRKAGPGKTLVYSIFNAWVEFTACSCNNNFFSCQGW